MCSQVRCFRGASFFHLQNRSVEAWIAKGWKQHLNLGKYCKYLLEIIVTQQYCMWNLRDQLYRNGARNIEIWAKFYLCPGIKYTFRRTDFNLSHSYSALMHIYLMCQILSRSGEKGRKKEQIFFTPLGKLFFCFIDFNETRKCWATLPGDIIYRVLFKCSYKSMKYCQNFIYALG